MNYIGTSRTEKVNKTEMKPKLRNRSEVDNEYVKKTEMGQEKVGCENKQNNEELYISELQTAIREKD
jgi:hypothetical protein